MAVKLQPPIVKQNPLLLTYDKTKNWSPIKFSSYLTIIDYIPIYEKDKYIPFVNKKVYTLINSDNIIKCHQCGRQGTHIVTYGHNNEPPQAIHIDIFCRSPRGMVLMNLDHILPKALGGIRSIKNLRPMCQPCNIKRGSDLSYQEFIQIISELPKYLVDSGRARQRFAKFVSLVELFWDSNEYNYRYKKVII